MQNMHNGGFNGGFFRRILGPVFYNVDEVKELSVLKSYVATMYMALFPAGFLALLSLVLFGRGVVIIAFAAAAAALFDYIDSRDLPDGARYSLILASAIPLGFVFWEAKQIIDTIYPSPWWIVDCNFSTMACDFSVMVFGKKIALDPAIFGAIFFLRMFYSIIIAPGYFFILALLVRRSLQEIIAPLANNVIPEQRKVRIVPLDVSSVGAFLKSVLRPIEHIEEHDERVRVEIFTRGHNGATIEDAVIDGVTLSEMSALARHLLGGGRLSHRSCWAAVGGRDKFEKIISFMTERGYVAYADETNPRKGFVLTDEGKRFLEHFIGEGRDEQ